MTIKRLVSAFFVFIGLAAGAHAYMYEQAPDKANTVHFRLTQNANTAAVSTHTILVDLSDTVNYPHKDTGHLVVDGFRLSVNKNVVSSCTFKLGVLNHVNPSTGSVTWFWAHDLTRDSTGAVTVDQFYPWPFPIRAKVNPGAGQTNGTTPYIISNDLTNGSTEIQADEALWTAAATNGSASNATPQVGDLIFRMFNLDAANAMTATVELLYHSEP